MPELEILARYGGQSLDELLAMEGTHRVDSLLQAMESALDTKAESRGAAAFSPQERILLAVQALECEVNNGGYYQFFINFSSTYAGEIEAALEAIGCPHHANIAHRALEALTIRGPITGDSVKAAASECSDEVLDALCSLDQEYYSCEESIEERLFGFVKLHKDRIQLR